MKITLTTERGEQVTIDLLPGENAWITTDAQPEQTSRSLFLDPQGELLGLGQFDTEQQWWDWRNPLNLLDTEA